jgi:hypothetical protein
MARKKKGGKKVETITVVKPAQAHHGGAKKRKRNRKKKGKGNGARELPAAFLPRMPKMRTPKIRMGNNSAIMSGKELLATVSVLSTTKIGDVLNRTDVVPSVLQYTRLQYLAQVFEKWWPVRWKITWNPQQGTNVAGNVIMYYDPDVSDAQTSGFQQAARAMTANGVDLAIWEKGKFLNCTVEKKNSDFYTSDGTDLRLSRAGYFSLVSNTDFTSNMTIGTLTLDYEIHFYKPILEGIASQPMSAAGACLFNSQTGSSPAGTSVTNIANYDIPISWLSTVAVTYPGAAGANYYVVFSVTGTTLASGGVLAFVGATVINSLNYVAVTSTQILCFAHIASAASTITVQFATFTGASITNSRFFVARDRNLTKPKPKYDIISLTERLENLESLLKITSDPDDDPTLKKTPQLPQPILVLDQCIYCGQENPDHLGRNCPQRANNAPVGRRV